MYKKRINFALIITCCTLSFGTMAQITTPALSPLAKTEQMVGITTVSVEYSRPSKKNRIVFTDIVPYGKIWRTGANKNTVFRIDKPIEIEQKRLFAGEYALYVLPERESWTVFFYKDTENYGLPKKWDDNLVVLKAEAHIKEVRDVETFTISIDDVRMSGASIVFSWDNVAAVVPFRVLDNEEIEQSIRKTLNDNLEYDDYHQRMLSKTAKYYDYYQATDHYVNAGGDMRQALEWIDLAIKIGGEGLPNWYWMRKAQIHAKLGEYEHALVVAKIGLRYAKNAGDEFNVKIIEVGIREWSKK